MSPAEGLTEPQPSPSWRGRWSEQSSPAILLIQLVPGSQREVCQIQRPPRKTARGPLPRPLLFKYLGQVLCASVPSSTSLEMETAPQRLHRPPLPAEPALQPHRVCVLLTAATNSVSKWGGAWDVGSATSPAPGLSATSPCSRQGQACPSCEAEGSPLWTEEWAPRGDSRDLPDQRGTESFKRNRVTSWPWGRGGGGRGRGQVQSASRPAGVRLHGGKGIQNLMGRIQGSRDRERPTLRPLNTHLTLSPKSHQGTRSDTCS